MRAFVFLLLLAGCSGVSATPVAIQGRPAYQVSCNGSTNAVMDCHRKASEVCPTGYVVLDRDVEIRDNLDNLGGMIGRIGMRRSLTVRCG